MSGSETGGTASLEDNECAERLTRIRQLKRSVSRWKREAENPDTSKTERNRLKKQIRSARKELEKIKGELTALGRPYQPTREEQRSISFDRKIPEISAVFFSEGGYFQGHSLWTLTVGEKIEMKYSSVPYCSKATESAVYPLSREDFFRELEKLHLGEWRCSYSTESYGFAVCDGIQWELVIKYRDGKTSSRFSGSNVFPYNYEELHRLLDRRPKDALCEG